LIRCLGPPVKLDKRPRPPPCSQADVALCLHLRDVHVQTSKRDRFDDVVVLALRAAHGLTVGTSATGNVRELSWIRRAGRPCHEVLLQSHAHILYFADVDHAVTVDERIHPREVALDDERGEPRMAVCQSCATDSRFPRS
jgi:hypothetical protein